MIPPFPLEFTYKVLAALDRPDQDLTSIFTECFDFIDEGRQDGGACLVHCFAGVSRSATITIAYLMHKGVAADLETALDIVKDERPFVNPNPGFMKQVGPVAHQGS